MGKVSKDDKIKLLEAKVSLLEAEVLLKDELLDFMQAGIDELTEKVKELGEKAKYFDAIYDKALEKSSEIIKSLTYERDELLNALRTENERYLRLQEDSEECVRSRDELVVKVSKLESEFKAIPAWIRKFFK